MLARMWQIIVKEFIQFRRDRLLTLFLLTFPILQLVLIARAAGSDVVNLPLAVLDQDRSQVSRGVIQAVDNTEELAVRYFPAGLGQLEELLDRGQATVAIVVPPNFAADLAAPGASPQLQVIVDGSNIVGGSVGLGAAEGAVNDYLYRYLAGNGLAPAAGSAPLELQTTYRFNPALDYLYNVIPAVSAFIIYQVTLIVASLGLVRERELGTLEQLIVTPLRRFELLSGKAIPAAIVGLISAATILAVATGLFRIPMKGSWSLLCLLTALFVAAEVGWGMMVSAFARTQQQAILIVFPLSMVDLSLSGYLVPVENMPWGLQMISTLSPLRHYITILRNLMLRGADLTNLWPEALALLALAIGVAFVSQRNIARSFE